MPDDKKIDIILEKLSNRYDKFNTYVLKKLGEIIKKFDGITLYEAYVLAQELQYDYEVYEMLDKLSKINIKTEKDMEDALDIIAISSVKYSKQFFEATGTEYVKYQENSELQKIVNDTKTEIKRQFSTMANSKNIGFVFTDEKGNSTYKPLSTVYNELIQKAVNNVATGVKDYQSAMRDTIKQLADSGVKVHEDKVAYESGYNRRIDSSVRQGILNGITQASNQVQEKLGEQFGADGVQITYHIPCAIDHLDINGKQFSYEKFEEVNSYLDRPVSYYNCRHRIMHIKMGVSQPLYSKKELKYARKESLKKVKYEGKTYTKYEATQVQRKLETAIRQQKDRQIIARASGNKQEIAEAQTKISQLTTKYNDFSKTAELETQKERLTVSGYRRVSTK